MQPPLQLLGNGINHVQFIFGGRPPGGLKIHTPASFPGPLVFQIGTKEGRPLGKVVAEGLCLVPGRCMAARLEDPPPGHAAPVVAHDGAHLPGAAGPQQLGNVAVRHGGCGGHQFHDGQHRLHVLNPH